MIKYLETRDFNEEQLQELFKSVNWLSANYPKRLVKAMKNCETVFTAWDNDKLVGLINAIDDGELTAYVHYLLVNPKYQGQGIASELLKMVKEKYKNYLYVILVAENKPLIQFYNKNGFEATPNTQVMEIINE
ncbi:MAG: GNAT family N-acetyltransferase [Oscillospiraceae bacterium]|nr:GNAT family N-acetyltransferase [Oscillospiraceae bacterium]